MLAIFVFLRIRFLLVHTWLPPVKWRSLRMVLLGLAGSASAVAAPVPLVQQHIQQMAVYCCENEAALQDYFYQVSHLPWQLDDKVGERYGADNRLAAYVVARLRDGQWLAADGYAVAIAGLNLAQQREQLALVAAALSELPAGIPDAGHVALIAYLLAQLRIGEPQLTFSQRLSVYVRVSDDTQRAALLQQLFNDNERIVVQAARVAVKE